MKFKKVMLVTFLLLAILTIGAISASEDVASDDSIAASDITEDPIEETPVDEVMAETPEDTVGVTAEDFNVNINNKTFDVDKDQNEVVFNFTAPQGADGDFDIFVNDKYKTCFELSDETAGKTFNVTLSQLYITEYGTLPISVRYGSGSNPTEVGSVTVFKYYSKDGFDTYTFDDVRDVKYRIYSFSEVPATGTLIVYVNGKESYTEHIDTKIPYLQLYVDDLGITENAIYNIYTEYVVDVTNQVIALDNYSSDVMCMPVSLSVSDMEIDIASDYVSSLGDVSDRNGIRGPVTVYIDGSQVFTKTYTVSDDVVFISINQYTLPSPFALGNHTVKIVYTRNSKEYSKEGNVSFYAEPKVTSPGYSMTVGEEKFFTVDYYKGSTGTLVVYNTVKDSTVSTGWKKSDVFMTIPLNGNGSVKIPLSSLDVGYHGLCLNFTLGTYSVEKFIDVNVMDIPDDRPYVYLKPAVSDIDYGQDAVVNVTVTKDGATYNAFTGNVLVQILYFNGISYVVAGEKTISLTNGVGSATFSNLNASDNYLVSLDANHTETFRVSPYSTSFNVYPVKVYVTGLQNVELDYGSSFNLTASAEGASGIYAEIEGQPVTVIDFTIPISGLGVGEYLLEVTPIVDSNHIPITQPVEIVIKQADSFLNTSDIILYGSEPADVTMVMDGATGLEAHIGEVTLSTNGNVISIPALSTGSYTLTVTTIPDGNHKFVTRDIALIVKKYNSAVSLSDEEIAFDYNTSGSVSVVSLTNASKVKAVVVDHPEAVIAINGIIKVSNLSAGNYVLEVTTEVDSSHEEATAYVNITVNKLSTHISLRNDIAFDYGLSNSTQFSADCEINVVVVDHPEAVVVVDKNNGQIVVSNLNAGTYMLLVTADVEDTVNYEIAVANVTVTVNKLSSGLSLSNDIAFDYGSSNSTRFTSNVDVVAKVINHPEAIVAVKDGEIMVSGLNAGKYALVVMIKEDASNYDVAVATVNVTVNPLSALLKPTSVTTTYGTSKYMYVTLTSNGTALAGKKVTFLINGVPYAAVTGAEGKAKIATPSALAVSSKAYSVTVSLSDGNYIASTASTSLLVKKATPKLTAKAKTFKKSTKTKKYTVTLKTDKNKALYKSKVYIKVNKKTYSAVVNKKGTATFKLTKLTKKGKYTATVTYKGDSHYLKAVKKVKINVK